MFSWKTMGLAKIGEKGLSKGQGKGSKSIRSFFLRTYIVCRMRVRELPVDWWVKVMPASLYPNIVVYGGLFGNVTTRT